MLQRHVHRLLAHSWRVAPFIPLTQLRVGWMPRPGRKFRQDAQNSKHLHRINENDPQTHPKMSEVDESAQNQEESLQKPFARLWRACCNTWKWKFPSRRAYALRRPTLTSTPLGTGHPPHRPGPIGGIISDQTPTMSKT